MRHSFRAAPWAKSCPARGRCRKPPAPETGAPLHGTALHLPLFRASTALLSGPVGRAHSFVALPSPKPRFRRPAEAGRTFCWGLGATYLRAPGARAAYGPVTPLAHLAMWPASRVGGPPKRYKAQPCWSTYPSRRPPHRTRGRTGGLPPMRPPVRRPTAREQQPRRDLVAPLPRVGGRLGAA